MANNGFIFTDYPSRSTAQRTASNESDQQFAHAVAPVGAPSAAAAGLFGDAAAWRNVGSVKIKWFGAIR
jgi:hypothetical protein